MRKNNKLLRVGKWELDSIFVYLVDVAHNHGGEEDLGEGDGHRVHGGHYGGVHEVDGVAVEENCGASHGDAHDYRPENVFET